MVALFEEIWHTQGQHFIALIIASISGVLIGIEREHKNKGAGIKTHALVCLGAALFMILSKYGFNDVIEASQTTNFDGTRVAAQIVTGIGFLGAGIIFHKEQGVSGLTTAAGIWVTAGIGMSIGGGMYGVALCATFLIILVQTILNKLSIYSKESFSGVLMIVTEDRIGILEEIEQKMKEERIEIYGLKLKKVEGQLKLTYQLMYPAGYQKHRFVMKLYREMTLKAVSE